MQEIRDETNYLVISLAISITWAARSLVSLTKSPKLWKVLIPFGLYKISWTEEAGDPPNPTTP